MNCNLIWPELFLLIAEFFFLRVFLAYQFERYIEKKIIKDFEKNFLIDPTESLYIIGNGFDLHHGIKSNYKNFQVYLKEHNSQLFETLTQHCDNTLLWSNWEEALGKIQFKDKKQFYNANYHRITPTSYHEEILKITLVLKNETKKMFVNWIKHLTIPSDKIIALNKDALFLNFNYTSTLEQIYDISCDRIIYIHNQASRTDDLIFGHANNDFRSISPREKIHTYTIDTSDGDREINSYLKATLKNVSSIIKKNRHFFAQLSNIGQIFIIGHSLSKIDHKYFKEISKVVSKYTIWTVTYYQLSEKETHLAMLNSLGILDKNIYLIRIEEINSWRRTIN